MSRSGADTDPLGTRSGLPTADGNLDYLDLVKLGAELSMDLSGLPVTIRVLLENVLRQVGSPHATDEDVEALARWNPAQERELTFMPARVLLQDFTGVPAVVDLAAMRSALEQAGAKPDAVDPQVPVDLVVDHSVQIDAFGTPDAFRINVEREYERNHERYLLLRWAQQAFSGFRVVPPGTGIVHQVNLEYLAQVVLTVTDDAGTLAIPDTLVGTDSHTPMVNGLGVLGWGVGGIEAEAAMLGQPMPLVLPKVVGVKLSGELQPGVTATDLVLTITALLRAHGVVGKFVEFHGDGVSSLSVPDRATLSNMTPEYGATACLFPVDDKTLDYMRLTGRKPGTIDLVERYMKAQGLFGGTSGEVRYTESAALDLSTVEPSMAGPSRPQDRVGLSDVGRSLVETFSDELGTSRSPQEIAIGGERLDLADGDVVIAAITSCTNTSNPSVMVGAGILARKAVERGLTRRPWVKTSLAPGSRVVSDYLERAGLLGPLEQLGFNVVGYGCTTCIGNSGPLPDPVAAAIDEGELTVAAVLSGNRNFEGRIHPQVRASYLASPPLVVAYALAGTVQTDLTQDPIGRDADGKPVMLADIWPTDEEIGEALGSVISDTFTQRYETVFEGDLRWRELKGSTGMSFGWDPESTYVREPPFFKGLSRDATPPEDVVGAMALAVLGDSVTTDHISPAGAIPADGPAGQWLQEHGVETRDFNSFGSRRGNHEVMIRGTFANIRLRNRMVTPREGGFTIHVPTGDEVTIFEAARRYAEKGTPLVIVAGKEYGSGSSRDWAAKGTRLLGVRAVIAESYERIHRSNLIGMGVLPLQFKGENAASLGLEGTEVYNIPGIAPGLTPGAELTVTASRRDGTEVSFPVLCRIDSVVEAEYYRNGGVLQYVLRGMLAG
ncbi:MAG: aconitate hydratase AcnA [Actinobacteria bacterium ATB1]|nr:aconitate hydratase AcnA [Actinobacteria bacterium ATB1]